jgi:TnpA family transposase
LDSTHFRSYDQNIFTEWHSRHGGRGILIYWHVERGYGRGCQAARKRIRDRDEVIAVSGLIARAVDRVA